VSERELNVHLKQGLSVDQYPEEKPKIQFGDAGSKWRMMKLKRIIEQAEDEGRSVQEVGLERYGSIEKLNEALAERDYLDKNKRTRRDDDDDYARSHRTRRYVYADSEKSAAFRRPENVDEFGREMKRRKTTPPPTVESERPSRVSAAPLPPIVNTKSSSDGLVIIPQHEMPQAFSPTERVMTRDELNKMNAKVMKAKIMGDDNAEELEKEYERQVKMQVGGIDASGHTVHILPTVDSEGRFYDYALKNDGTISSDRKGKNKERFKDTHDPRTGERLKYGTVDDAMSLMDMVRQEKAGSRATSNMDLEFANKIMTDASFENNLDYMDEKADVMGARKGLTEEQKMRYAVKDYKRTQEALEKCRLCYHGDKPPQLAMISLGMQVYLALPNVQELTPGHCMIVPVQHVTSTLELDDDAWDEIRNFQKCLLQMFNEQGCGVIFMETVVKKNQHRHTAIEAIPVPYGTYEQASAYFREAMLQVGEEWSQHKKIINTTERGFRRSMVSDLPYFHVWCGLESSYGHVIEDEKKFPYWFGKETIAGMLDIGPERWRRPKYYHHSENRSRQQIFLKDWEKWDWT
ncbi:CwfJ C-terminus 1-domain-containing protein-like protein, partial [Dichotomocladium elegans]